MNRIAVWVLCMGAVGGLLAIAAGPIGAAGVSGRSYDYTTYEEMPHTGCTRFDPSGVLQVDVDGLGYEGVWRQRRFRRRTFYTGHVVEMGVNYYTRGRMPTNGMIVGTAVQDLPGGWVVRYSAIESTCTPVAP